MLRPCCPLLGLVAVLAASLIASGADGPPAKPLAIKGALIKTQTDAGEFVGTIVIQGGKVAAVGPNVQPPAGATIVDASRCVITPGLIDARGKLGLNPAAADEGGRDATLNIVDAIDPFNEDWRDAARQGVTAVYVQPASSGNLGGSGAVLRVGPTDTAEGLAIRATAAVQAALGTAPRAETPAANPLSEFLRGRGIQLPTQPQTPTPPPAANSLTRYAQYEQLKGQFEAAKKYADSKPTKKELPKELLAQAVKGEIPVRIEVNNEDDIRNALKLTTEYGLRPVFERVERSKVIPEELTKSKSALIVGQLLGGRPSAEVRKLALDGRRFAIGTYGTEGRTTVGLRLHAAAAVAAGYPRERVLAALTSEGADVLGVGSQLGRIAVGRPADLVVFAGDPLDPSAPVRLAVSQGRITHEAANAKLAPLPLLARPTLPDKLPADYVLKTTRLLTPSGEFAPGELHIVNGRLNGPGGSTTPVIDLGDAPVTPGLVSAFVTMIGESAPDADASHLRATDLLAAEDGRLKSLRDGGCLTTILAPSSANVLAGVASAIRQGETPTATDIGLKLVLSNAARSRDRYPVSLAGQVDLLSARLRGSGADSDLYLPPSIRNVLLAERDRVLNLARDRQLSVGIEAQTKAEIRAALNLISEYKLRGVLVQPRDVDGLTDEIRQAGVGVVVGPVRPQDQERQVLGLVALGQAGVPLAFSGDAAELRASAALLANAGLTRSTVRRALVGAGGDPLGLNGSTGRLQPGDAADFVVWTGDPLDTTSRTAAVIVQGKRVASEAVEAAPSAARGAENTPARPRTRGRNEP